MKRILPLVLFIAAFILVSSVAVGAQAQMPVVSLELPPELEGTMQDYLSRLVERVPEEAHLLSSLVGLPVRSVVTLLHT